MNKDTCMYYHVLNNGFTVLCTDLALLLPFFLTSYDWRNPQPLNQGQITNKS